MLQCTGDPRRWPLRPSRAGKRSRCRISSSSSASCAARDWSRASAGRGGYHLARPQREVSVADIILAVDEPIDATQCGGKENCLDDRRCMTHDLWMSLNAHIFSFLSAVTLAELVQQQQAEGVAVLRDHRHAATGPAPPVPAAETL